MKSFLMKSFRIIGFIFLFILGTLLIWANWDAPTLSEKINLKPINLVVFNIDKPTSSADSIKISQKLQATKGVTAYTVNPNFKTVSVTFYEDEVSETSLGQLIKDQNYLASKVNFAQMDGPKCPIPAEYIDGLSSLKRILCFR